MRGGDLYVYTSFLCEAVELLFLTTPNQVESLHCDVIGNLASCEEQIGPLRDQVI